MGSRSVRITRQDFVTPPEFNDLCLAPCEAARLGGARIELTTYGDETRLGTCYQQIPVRLMPPFSFSGEAASLLYLINLTAGLMDGDGHCLEITAQEGTRSVVTGQSATRVHPALASFSTQQWAVEVKNDAHLVVLPGPLIPFRGCRYFQRGRVELAPGGKLIWGDIWLPGRYERGELSERFQFERIIQDFEVRREGHLVFRDRFCWNGPWSSEDASWHFGGEMCAASLFVTGSIPDDLFVPEASMRRAVFPLESGDTCIRWCGAPGAVTVDLALTALRLAAFWTNGPSAPPWLLSSSSLTPNHWFSASTY